jgi:hypothetical protein
MHAKQAEVQVDTLQARLRDMVLRAYIAELGRQVHSHTLLYYYTVLQYPSSQFLVVACTR